MTINAICSVLAGMDRMGKFYRLGWRIIFGTSKSNGIYNKRICYKNTGKEKDYIVDPSPFKNFGDDNVNY